MQFMLLLKDSKNSKKCISNALKFCQIYVVMWSFAKFMDLYEVLPKLNILIFFSPNLWSYVKFCQNYGSMLSFGQKYGIMANFATNMELYQVLPNLWSYVKF